MVLAEVFQEEAGQCRFVGVASQSEEHRFVEVGVVFLATAEHCPAVFREGEESRGVEARLAVDVVSRGKEHRVAVVGTVFREEAEHCPVLEVVYQDLRVIVGVACQAEVEGHYCSVCYYLLTCTCIVTLLQDILMYLPGGKRPGNGGWSPSLDGDGGGGALLNGELDGDGEGGALLNGDVTGGGAGCFPGRGGLPLSASNCFLLNTFMAGLSPPTCDSLFWLTDD